MFLLLYWPTYSDAGSDNLYSLFHCSAKPFFNLSYWNDPAYDKLVDTGAAIDGHVGPRRRRRLLEGDAAALRPGAGRVPVRREARAARAERRCRRRTRSNINYPFVTFFYPIQKPRLGAADKREEPSRAALAGSRRLLTSFLTLFGITTITFLLARVVPVDPAVVYIGPLARPGRDRARDEAARPRPAAAGRST